MGRGAYRMGVGGVREHCQNPLLTWASQHEEGWVLHEYEKT